MSDTKIQWTDVTWNPVTGCTPISPGCDNCYAEPMALRLQKMGQPNYVNGFAVTLQPHMLAHPLRWKKPRRIFVNSMSDAVHGAIPLDYIQQIFAVMVQASRHQFQLLTKRPERLAKLAHALPWPANVWAGTSVEHADYLPRIAALQRVPAAIRFLSLEPLLGPLAALPLEGIDWVIVGGESGPGARPMDLEWARDIRQQCASAGVPFFFKQVGGRGRNKGGRLLDGQEWNAMPMLHESGP